MLTINTLAFATIILSWTLELLAKTFELYLNIFPITFLKIPRSWNSCLQIRRSNKLTLQRSKRKMDITGGKFPIAGWKEKKKDGENNCFTICLLESLIFVMNPMKVQSCSLGGAKGKLC